MLLTLKNIGRLKNAEVKINGITVICGNNNTGKSTVGKILYCIYDSLHELEESIQYDRANAVINSVGYFFRPVKLTDYKLLPSAFERDIFYRSRIEEAIDSGKTGKDIVSMIIKLFGVKLPEADIKELSDTIDTRLKISAREIVSSFVSRRIEAEFGESLSNVNHPRRKSSVELRIKDASIIFSSSRDQITVEKFISLHKNLIYIDDPFIIDEINNRRYGMLASDVFTHRSRLLRMFVRNSYRTEQTSTEEIIDSKKIKQIIGEINKISDGELVFEGGKFTYKHSGLRKSLSLQSVSTGIKTFIIIKKLLRDGILEENGIAVFDEPEVHLHPEWQIKFAEIIVMLHKAYGLNIVLTTHSMEFLSAIDHFSQVHGIEDVCSYYLTELEKAKSTDDFPDAVMREMTGYKEKLYASISAPFLALYKQMNG